MLDNAVDIFWERGYEGTGIQEICRVSGLNPGSVYAAFGDKHDLFIQALKRYMTAVSLEAIERLNSSPSGRAGISSYYQTLIDSMLDGKRRWGCLVTNAIVEFAMRDPRISEAYHLHLARLETAFIGVVERGKREGELPGHVNASEAAMFLICTTQGMNVLAKTRPPRQVLESIVRHAFAAIGLS
ncbi:TetR/AcrR family transcriptional regulator [Caballeronia sp. LP003]|uniref:TetR/AcrR family transcriptional regulator n=1 Tax=Caballeronia sp. LP003 TaxID=3038551 RepID=UPI00285CA3A3|nr:TetR/AcrR family transcriptional regulator [Caballeronia sp. LP003]MDR5785449.1 TetR/AcrR family transcriptional regulator [Caballeronia sp. LP003]